VANQADTRATGNEPPAGPIGSRGWPQAAREFIRDPANLLFLPVAVITLVGRHVGFVADQPAWLLLGTLALAQFATAAFALAFPPGTARAKPRVHLAISITVVALAIYAAGWGALVSIGFVFVTFRMMSNDGAWLGRWAMLFVGVAIVLGETTYALGWLKTLQTEPQGHGLAALEYAGIACVIFIVSMSQREKEVIDASLRRSEERLRALVQHASDAIIVLKMDGSVLFVSPAIEQLLGYPPDEFTVFDESLIHDEHRDAGFGVFSDIVQRPGAVTWIELRLRHANGDYRWFEIGVTNRLDDPAVGGLVCNMRDVTERRSSQEQLEFQAHHDALTRLPNRWLFLERLEDAQRAARADAKRYVGVLFLDVDRFKLVNDSLGHEVGDRMLIALSERLESCLKPRDTVARFGGDEFTILLEGLPDPDIALLVADRVIEVMREPVTIDGHEMFVSASVGIALSRAGADRASDLLRQADLAMYVAKEKGRGRWELFDPTFAPHVMDRLELEGDLWRALEHDELTVHFQPEVSLTTGQVIATEALLRWMHPRRGMLPPEKFVPMAEESSLIVAIDRFVLREACRWARRWSTGRPVDRPLVVSVNLSPRFMRQAEVVTDITSVLRETNIDPRCLQLEITERLAVTDIDATCSQLHQLRALGVRVAVDDFGTGYSSLSYLKQLPIDVLKLDKSFVDGLDGTHVATADLAIVQAIVTMGHALGVKVTAEGVERPEQAARLRELGCDSGMGWLWSKSVPPEQLGELAHAGFSLSGDRGNAVVVPLRARA
jgi:diguanylate cyclase (GGDEF)-like protein/PAS domain S-box-containing protein